MYNGHGDVVALTDSSGTVVASYTYDAFGTLLSSSENFPGGWSNPYRFDGADLVRYDSETGLYWMSVRAYNPTLGRFISHDSLGRLAAEGIDFAPYVYTGNNPVVKVDPSGERAVYCTPGDPGCGPGGCPTGYHPTGNGCSNSTPTPDPTGGCGTGWHSTNNGCINDGSGCLRGFQSGKGGCVYDSGDCAGKTVGGCNQFKEAQRAKQSLLSLWTQHDREANFVSAIIGLLGGALNLIGTVLLSGTMFGLLTGILGVIGLLPQLMQVLKTGFISITGSVPTWILALAPTIDMIGTAANIINFALGFMSISMGVGEGAVETVEKMVKGGISLMVGSVLQGLYNSFGLLSLDQDDEYRYELANIWDPATIIAQCKIQGGAAC